MSDMDVVMEEVSPRQIEERELIQPVALLMDELKSEDTAIRVESMKRLQTISLALGPERTRNELVPFLQCSLDEEDEVLSAMVDELVGLIEHVGGTNYAHVILPLLEGLVSAEEPYVRNKALIAYSAVIEIMSMMGIVEHVIPSVQRLTVGDWFSKKNSAAALIVLVFKRLLFDPNEKDKSAGQNLLGELLRMFESLVFEETPLVRKAVANNLAQLALITKNTIYLQNLVPICVQLANDSQDSVRLLSVEPLAILLKECEDDSDKISKLLPLFFALAGDSSWRIRFMTASNYGKLALALQNQSGAGIDVLGIYCALLKDVEAEVRAAACNQISDVSSLFNSASLEEHIISTIRVLLTDPSSHVRASLALQLNDLARVLGADLAASLVLPMILQLLRDDSSEVRLNVISKLDIIVEVIGIQQLSASLLPAIIALAEDRQWRGREFFEEKILSLLIGWLEDPVFAVRETSIDALKRVIRQFGSEWTDDFIIPRLIPLATHRNYLRRVTFLYALSSTCSAVTTTALCTQFLPILEQLAADPIANVRFNVAKTLQSMVPIIISSAGDPDVKETIGKSIIPTLQQLQRDSDIDVHNFATQALNIIPAF